MKIVLSFQCTRKLNNGAKTRIIKNKIYMVRATYLAPFSCEYTGIGSEYIPFVKR